jgi:DNA mismatch endonuclease (patch repair protein)
VAGMDRISKEARSRNMSRILSKNTTPEKKLRKALWSNGLRYRIHYGKEKIDIAFPSKKIAVFVDGCFWHMCPLHYRLPKSNTGYWHPKLKANVKRDRIKEKLLKKAGWKVFRFWEHDVVRNIDSCIERIHQSSF